MLKSESFLNRWQAQARIALDDDAANADGIELTRLLLRKTAHAHKMMVVAGQLPGHASRNVSCFRPGQELFPSVSTTQGTHVEPLTAHSPRGQVLVDDPFRPSKVFEGHELAVLDIQGAPVADVDTAAAGA